MPFKKLDEVEFNFIWVGGNKMPDNQVDNLINFVLQSRVDPTTILMWVDNKATYEVLVAQLQAHIKLKNAEIDGYNAINKKSVPHISFKDQLKNLRFKTIGVEELEIPPTLDEFIEKTRVAKLWAGLSDVYRLLILSRKYKEKEPHIRFYVEADNMMKPALWSFFKGHEVAATCYKTFGKYKKVFAPTSFRSDLLLLDITSEQGIGFAANIRTNLLKIVDNPVLKIYFAELLENAIKNDGLEEEDILGTYGMFIGALFRMHFLLPNKNTLYGFKDIIVPIETISELYGPITRSEGRSWLNSSKQLAPLEGGMLKNLIRLKICEISDQFGLATQETLEEIGIDSKEDLWGLTEMMLRLNSLNLNHALPQWFLDARNNENVQKPSEKAGATPKPGF